MFRARYSCGQRVSDAHSVWHGPGCRGDSGRVGLQLLPRPHGVAAGDDQVASGFSRPEQVDVVLRHQVVVVLGAKGAKAVRGQVVGQPGSSPLRSGRRTIFWSGLRSLGVRQ